MKVLMTGGTGFVGSFLTARLVRDGHEVSILVRNEIEAKTATQNVSLIQGDPTVPGPWQRAVMNHDVIMNLAGATIFTKWTQEQKKAIRESRVGTTRNIVESIDGSLAKAITLISTSAVGYYGFHGDEELAEDAPPGHDFFSDSRTRVGTRSVAGRTEGGQGLHHAFRDRFRYERWIPWSDDSAF